MKSNPVVSERKTKAICVQTFAGRNIYILTTEEFWTRLTESVEVFSGCIVNGWEMPDGLVQSILDSGYPQRMDYEVVAITPWKDIYQQMGLMFTAKPPTPDYYISYSSIK